MRRIRPTSLIIILVIAVVAIVAVFASGSSPHLGLDLQGGASVVLTPKNGNVPHDALEQAKSIISNRVDGLGVAEPDIHIEGNNIVVALPGVKNANSALGLVGQTAELRFRPVLCVYPATGDAAATASCSTYLAPTTDTSTTVAGDTSTTVAGDTSTTAAGATSTTVAGDTSTTAAGATSTTAAGATSTTVAGGSTTATTTKGGSTTTTAPAEATCGTYQTSEADDVPDAQVVLMGSTHNDAPGVCYVMGPTFLTGKAVTFAQAQIVNGAWQVALHLKGGAEGIDTWNQTAQLCFNSDATCPTRQLAIVLDGVVESAPQIEPSESAFSPFDKNSISISGSFSQSEAKNLALVLRYGSLPVELVPQTVQTVSATLGKDSLHAGLIAGLAGLLLVALYILFYYRALGLVVVLGMGVWAALNYAIITYLSARSGLALSLAGVTGIIVSVGVTVDSYVVFFERLKDEVRSGKTVRSSVDRGFQRAFRTVITADVSSFMGAALLYLLTVGSVRGFAFFLGLATLLDVVVTWMFTRPLVAYLSRSRFFTGTGWFSVSTALGVESAPDPVPVGAGR
jgi:preprotein translocase subunit SecD